MPRRGEEGPSETGQETSFEQARPTGECQGAMRDRCVRREGWRAAPAGRRRTARTGAGAAAGGTASRGPAA